MFTIRVNHGRPTQAGPSPYTVHACARYAVAYAGDVARISLWGGDGAKADSDVVVGEGEVAYVMNAQGTTVDVVDVGRRLRAAGGRS